ncbi:MAG: DNA replication/repair protein RecF [Alphaproteobacteria bacterium]|nr:DNA replication/repair protein RecF [Alphaproteobacteria bacterium]
MRPWPADPDTAPARLAVVTLTLTAFRNYARLRLVLDGRPVVLAGPNGAGKTNILEAISYLGAGRGLRGARLGDVDQRREGATRPWAVAAVLDGPHGRFEVGTGRDGAAAVHRRLVRIDGKPRSGPAALADRVPVLWLTPDQDRLFLDQPAARRRFLDKLVAVLDPAHSTRINEYERALRERARLLKEPGADPDWLSALERTMAETGIAIAAARLLAVADLTRTAARGIGPFPAAVVAAVGKAEDWLARCPALEAEDRLAGALAGSRAQDAEAGGAAHGPHRTDMAVSHGESGLAAAALSTGEQKCLLLSIVLGAARIQAEKRGFAPLLLLDEVSAHLDEDHRRALYREVAALGAQAWMTGTDATLFSVLGEGARFLRIADGCVYDSA